MKNQITTSPLPRKVMEEKKDVELNFYDALKEVMKGNKITKLEWGDKKTYGLLENETLLLCKEDGKKYQWIIRESDVVGKDWIIIV